MSVSNLLIVLNRWEVSIYYLKTMILFYSFIRTGSLCTMMICSSQYPEILAFSFLTELQREFLLQYKNEDIQKAKRPYTFVEFGMLLSSTFYLYLLSCFYNHVSYWLVCKIHDEIL